MLLQLTHVLVYSQRVSRDRDAFDSVTPARLLQNPAKPSSTFSGSLIFKDQTMAARLFKIALASSLLLPAAVLGDSGKNHWVDVWGCMPQLTEPANLPPAPFVSPSLSHD